MGVMGSLELQPVCLGVCWSFLVVVQAWEGERNVINKPTKPSFHFLDFWSFRNASPISTAKQNQSPAQILSPFLPPSPPHPLNHLVRSLLSLIAFTSWFKALFPFISKINPRTTSSISLPPSSSCINNILTVKIPSEPLPPQPKLLRTSLSPSPLAKREGEKSQDLGLLKSGSRIKGKRKLC